MTFEEMMEQHSQDWKKLSEEHERTQQSFKAYWDGKMKDQGFSAGVFAERDAQHEIVSGWYEKEKEELSKRHWQEAHDHARLNDHMQDAKRNSQWVADGAGGYSEEKAKEKKNEREAVKEEYEQTKRERDTPQAEKTAEQPEPEAATAPEKQQEEAPAPSPEKKPFEKTAQAFDETKTMTKRNKNVLSVDQISAIRQDTADAFKKIEQERGQDKEIERD